MGWDIGWVLPQKELWVWVLAAALAVEDGGCSSGSDKADSHSGVHGALNLRDLGGGCEERRCIVPFSPKGHENLLALPVGQSDMGQPPQAQRSRTTA